MLLCVYIYILNSAHHQSSLFVLFCIVTVVLRKGDKSRGSRVGKSGLWYDTAMGLPHAAHFSHKYNCQESIEHC